MTCVFITTGPVWSLQVISPEGPIPIPPGLGAGDSFHLVFATSNDRRRDGMSGDIQDYNGFVQDAANMAGIGESEGVSWFAIASTADVNAKENAIVSAPVFTTRGYTTDNTQMEMVALGAEDMWDGSIEHNIDWDEFGELVLFDTWTGSLPNGLAVQLRGHSYSGAGL